VTTARIRSGDARAIRERFARGDPVLKLAHEYGVSDQTIKDILNFETWVSAGGPRLSSGRHRQREDEE